MPITVLGASAVPLMKISLVVERIRPSIRGLIEIWDSTNGGFVFWLPKQLESKIAVGDTLHILCVPTPDLSIASQTLACARFEKSDRPGTGSRTEILWEQSNFWGEQWSKFD